MTPLRIMSVVGARPNFMKIAPFVRALQSHGGILEHCLVHTGQHYDREMSSSFFEALHIPAPDVDLEIGSGSHAEQVGRTMIAFEPVVREWNPDWIVVVGDVNATCACSITAKKEHRLLAHIEAGLRSFDLRMPEEINRMVTDRLSDLLFTPDRLAGDNLRREGTPEDRIRFVGNIMIDTLEAGREEAARLDARAVVAHRAISGLTGARAAIEPDHFGVVTLHRPSNVDDPAILGPLVEWLAGVIAPQFPLVWSLHPRTRQRLEAFGLWDRLAAARGITLVGPLGYHEMLCLNLAARIMLTDSGGLQEECCVTGTPCLTLRENTERPATLIANGGVSELTGNRVERMHDAFQRLNQIGRHTHRPERWDGHTAERIAGIFAGLATNDQRSTAPCPSPKPSTTEVS